MKFFLYILILGLLSSCSHLTKTNTRAIANTTIEQVHLVVADSNISIKWSGFKPDNFTGFQVQLKTGALLQTDWTNVGVTDLFAFTEFYSISSLGHLGHWSCYYVRALYKSGKASEPVASPPFLVRDNKLNISQDIAKCG